MGKVNPVANTLRDYAEAATVHGVSYVFSRSLPLIDRLVWGLITLTCLSLAAYWSVTAYGNWQENLVVTSLKDPAMSVTSLPFPAVTICNINRVNCHNAFLAFYNIKSALAQPGLNETFKVFRFEKNEKASSEKNPNKGGFIKIKG